MKKIYLIIFYLIAWEQNSFAQQAIIDSLIRTIPQLKNDSVKVDTYLEITFKYTYSKPDSAIIYAQKAENLARKIGNQPREAFAIYRKGGAYRSKGDLVNGLRYYKQSLEFAQKLAYQNLIARNTENIGLIYFAMGDSRLALSYCQKALVLFEKLKDYERLAITFNNMGEIYTEIGKYDSAEYFLEKALPLAKTYSPETQSFIWQDLSKTHWRKKQYQLAKMDLAKSIFFAEKYFNMRNLSASYHLLAEIQLLENNLEEALKSAEKAVKIAEEGQMKGIMYEAYEVYSKILEVKGDYKNALKYKNLYIFYKEKVQSQSTKNNLQVLEYDKKANEVALLRAEKDSQLARQQLFIYLTTATLILIVIVTLLIFRSRQNMQKINTQLHLAHQEIQSKQEEILAQNEELKQSNEFIQGQTETLEDLNDLKDKLFSIISHDLRSPLNSLQGALALLEDDNLPPQEFKEIAIKLAKNVNYTVGLLNNLLPWANSQMQGVSIQSDFFDLKELADNQIGLFEKPARDKKINLINQIPSATIVFADKNMIDLVLRNLVANAIKFCRSEDQILLSANWENDFIKVNVADTGVGISEENLSKLFDKQVFSTQGTANEKGTGLGLILCKDFIEKNKGRIWVESELDKGSIFHFTLPVSKENS